MPELNYGTINSRLETNTGSGLCYCLVVATTRWGQKLYGVLLRRVRGRHSRFLSSVSHATSVRTALLTWMNLCVVEAVWLIPCSHVLPDVLRIPQTANGVPNSHHLYGNILSRFLEPTVPRPFGELPVGTLDLDSILLWCSVDRPFLSPITPFDRGVRWNGFVVRIHLPKLGHGTRLTDANTANQTCASTHRVRTAREAEEE